MNYFSAPEMNYACCLFISVYTWKPQTVQFKWEKNDLVVATVQEMELQTLTDLLHIAQKSPTRSNLLSAHPSSRLFSLKYIGLCSFSQLTTDRCTVLACSDLVDFSLSEIIMTSVAWQNFFF